MSYWTVDELEDLLTDLILQYGKHFPDPAGDYTLTPAMERERAYGRLEAFAALIGCPIGTEEGNADLHAEINLARRYLAEVPQPQEVS